MKSKIQKTLLEPFPQDQVRGDYTPSYNTQDHGDTKEPYQETQERQLSHKDLILSLLLEMDRVPVKMLLNISAQYNARINELNKDLIKQDPPQEIVSVYDKEEKVYYKRLEVIK